MAVSLATPTLPPPLSALEKRLGVPVGSLQGEDRDRALEALDDAATLVLAEVPANKVDAWRFTAPKVAVLVALKAARREWENPSGYESESLGERSVGISETSGVYLTDREVDQIRRAATGRRTNFVGTVRTASAFENA